MDEAKEVHSSLRTAAGFFQFVKVNNCTLQFTLLVAPCWAFQN